MLRRSVLLSTLAVALLAACHLSIGKPVRPPEKLSLSAATGKLVLAWSPVAGASGYRVYLASAAGVTRASYATLADGREVDAARSPLVLPLATKAWHVVVTAIVDGAESSESAELVSTPLSAARFDSTPFTTTFGAGPADHYGGSVTIGDFDGDGFPELAVGSRDAGTSQGAVYVYRGSSTGPVTAPLAATVFGAINFERLGVTISHGDVDGNGIDDLVVGDGGTGGAKVHVFFGLEARMFDMSIPTEYAVGNDPIGANLSVGDFDGDGLADLVAAGYDVPNDASDAVAFHGSHAPFATPALAVSDFPAAVGASATLADVNGDGLDDVIVGAPLANGGAGELRVWLGPIAGSSPDLVVPGAPGSGFGAGLARAGDVNGDGRDELLVISAPALSSSNATVSLVAASAGTLAPTGWTFTLTPGSFDAASRILHGIGDVDGDGLDDVLIGDEDFDGAAGAGSGRVLMFVGSGGTLSSSPAFSMEGTIPGAFFGAGAALGDVDGDGRPDLFVGADFEDSPIDSAAGSLRGFHGNRQRGPHVDAGYLLQTIPGQFRVLGAYFDDPHGARLSHQCTLTLDGVSQTIPDCHPSDLAGTLLQGRGNGRHYFVLSVEASDGAHGEAATTTVSE